ncbi:hypothetical protein KP509_20G068100 [Ceratopteris richardii]|uniref:Uncharacterized protein n=1 Tax=Ceratopteris richardii TaxID=49495 RepID=A0A8T2SHW6_CERRI|nr:hypothetical protein KP509_20G067900 [Ceratopteris richardii]KAH7332102.1 hypothetical protein KP509_20G068100 [Ceratopteris richardii]
MAIPSKLMAGLIFVLLMAVCSPRGEAIRDVGLREVSEVALEEQEQVIRLQENMEAAKRHLLMHDPYYHHWFGAESKH